MKSIKCSNCALTNWSTSESCKRCGAALSGEDMPYASHQSERASYQYADPRQSANYLSPQPQVKGARLVSFGVLLLILGGIMAALHLGASMRGARFPMYYLVLGVSLMASGVVFCMKQWSAVYVYLLGFGFAVVVMILTEGVVQKPLQRIGGPTILGLFLLNKMLKAKKAAALDYAGQ